MFACLVPLALVAVAMSAQTPDGALAGKLTDIHSRPLDGVTVTLRNAHTGAQVSTVTSKGGTYLFKGLLPGEYALEAENRQGNSASASRIQIAGGHESRVQTALNLTRETAMEAGAAGSRVPALMGIEARSSVQAGPLLPPPPLDRQVPFPPVLSGKAADAPIPDAVPLSGKLAYEAPSTLPLPDRAVTMPASERGTALAGNSNASGAPTSAPMAPIANLAIVAPLAHPIIAAVARAGTAGMPIAPEITAIHPGALAALVALSAAEIALTASMHAASPIDVATSPTAVGTLTGEQVEQIPLPGRHWESFVLDTPVSSGGSIDSEGPEGSRAGPQQSLTVDGTSTRSAFGGQTAGGGGATAQARSAVSEAAIQEFRIGDRDGAGANAPGGERVELETKKGTERLHGQAFLFDRQKLWGAQNPFTQWVKEVSPGTSIATPVFAGSPYTPGNTEVRMGAGIGDQLRWHRIFWFATIDESRRNHPAVSTVRHPDHFFAQPSNDEMQVLSARLRLSAANPVAEGVQAYSKMLESLAGLLGPAPRTSQHWTGSGRLDWKVGERHRLAIEGAGSVWNSPGGGLSRASETYGNHSFGATNGSNEWALARWVAFLTPNLMSVTQGSMRLARVSLQPEAPSAFEQTFNANVWGRLPQMTVDSRYGFTIGNPARFGPGTSPDEHVYQLQETLSWVRSPLLMKAGFDLRHSADSTSLLPNHGGNYSYSSVENFISDALVFSKYGLTDALDPMEQHNCDPRGKAWRDTTGQLHGLGYLPCYSYYRQTLGPTDWHLSTNDLAGFATAQWQPARQLVATASLRWDREQLPPPIALVNNPDLPLTQQLPKLGSQWSPRLGLAWGKSESHWPVLRFGYGMYAGRTNNGVLETALTETGSLKGDLNFFMRPTDNLQIDGGGAPPFPYVLGGNPSRAVKPGAVEFASNFHNAEIHQGLAEIEKMLPGKILVSVSAAVSLARRLPVTVDTNYDPAANPKTITYTVVDASGKGPISKPQITVPFYATWPGGGSSSGRLNENYQQITEIASRANSTYEAATVRVSRNARRGLAFNARYTYGHAMDWNPNESSRVAGSSVFDPSNFALEYGTSNLDQRHTASLMAIWQAPWNRKGPDRWLTNGWILSGTGQVHSGLPYSMRTAGSIARVFNTNGAMTVGLGTGMNGFGGDNRVYGVGRNTYRHPQTWKADLRLGRRFGLGHGREAEVLAESFNLFNHQNVTEVETTGYTIAPGGVSGSMPTLNFLTGLKTGQTEFGQPLNINAVDYYRERQFDLGLRLRF